MQLADNAVSGVPERAKWEINTWSNAYEECTCNSWIYGEDHEGEGFLWRNGKNLLVKTAYPGTRKFTWLSKWRSLTVLIVSRSLVLWVNQRNRHWYVALQWLNNIDECWREDASTSNDQQPVKQYTIQHTRCSYNNSHTRFSKGHPEIYSYMTIVLNVQAVLFWAFRSRSFLTPWS